MRIVRWLACAGILHTGPMPRTVPARIVRADTGATLGTIPDGYRAGSLADFHVPGWARRNDPAW